MDETMDEATHAQVIAADPAASTWLSANAGSGKTRVLTDRVARLLLSGVPPQSILCLTFTKAAAAEMQNRLFATLGTWAMMPEAVLRDALRGLAETGPLDKTRLARAQRLFARAIETPGGLKIQTIHAFCASLLRRFPLEAGVSPQFTEMDEAALDEMIFATADKLAAGPDAPLLDAVVAAASDDAFDGLLRGMMKERALFDPPLARAEVFARLGLPSEFDEAALCAMVFDGSETDLLSRVIPVLSNGSATDVKLAQALSDVLPIVAATGTVEALEGPMLFGATAAVPFGSKAGKLGTKGTRAAADPVLLDCLDALADRVAKARPLRLALRAAEQSAALHAFAARFLPAVDAAKQARGWLDFDDLILRSRALLSNPAVAQWVLYKLDGGIAHILVDEAQDTSPAQWDVIGRLTREIIAGADHRDAVPRTLFVVGDAKQSIYSFQGAAPDAFGEKHDRFTEDLSAQGLALDTRALHFSFRSAPAVLEAVDATFSGHSGGGFGEDVEHRAFFPDLPGRVDLWPALPPAERDTEERAWDDPLDRVAVDDPSAILARRIAATVRGWIDDGETLPLPDGTRRSIAAGDVLILVQRRGTLFHQIIRACKAEGLPIAGADRLRLSDALAVKDLIALLSFLATPEDDLSLAAVLRSPLLGWSEDDLFRLAHGRRATLWEALRSRDDRRETLDLLWDLLDQTDFLRPYDLLERLLTRHGGRRRLVARLGPECEEAIDALLALALDYEQREVPSLTGFLTWFTAEDVEIKRQADSGGGGQLRVMTVHGAKGLEEQIVILPDCAQRQLRNRDMLLRVGDPGWMAWKPASGAMPPALQDAAEDWRRRQAEERDRLLYVAMTRARCWLIVCAAGKTGKAPADSWYGTVAAGLETLETAALETPVGSGRRLASGDWAGGPLTRTSARPGHGSGPLPGWIATRAPRPDVAPRPLAPSGLGGAKALPGEIGLDPDSAMRRGRHLHLLLEHLPALPEPSWARLVPGILALDEAPPEQQDATAILDDAIRVLTDPALSLLFGPDSLAEVEISAELPDFDARILGQIDRLIVAPDRVLAVDFKTNMLVPEGPGTVPDGLLRQLGAYAVGLAQIYPDRPVETAILWTAVPRLMPLPHSLVIDALRTTDLSVLHGTAS
ncbi:MAG: double-strand break repair helicase AddA [Pseudomonadota bacterium]